MKTILDLFLVNQSANAAPENFSRMASLAAEHELEFRRTVVPRKPDGTVEMQALLDQVLQAQGFWMNDMHLLSNPEVREAVEERLAQGAIAVASVSHAHGSRYGSEFFEDLGLLSTSIRASVSSEAPNSYGHPMLVVADRDSYEIGFRDPTLFSGVERLLLQQANGIGCVGGAQTILALPINAIDPIDTSKDLKVMVPRPELPVIASTARSNWQGGRVIAMSLNTFGDAYQGPMGHRFPGIEAEDNLVFARNLLSVFAGARGANQSWESVRSVVTQFETSIARMADKILTSVYGDNWFEKSAPEKVMKKCRESWKNNGQAATPQSYLSLFQFMELFKENWTVIEGALKAVGVRMTLAEVKLAISEVNPIRNEAMHPTKALFGGRTAPTANQLTVLRTYTDLMVSAERALRNTPHQIGL